MKKAGHDQNFRTTVMIKAITKYRAVLSNMTSGVKPLYRSKEDRITQQEADGATTKQSWFQKLGYQVTLTVPASVDSTLMTAVKAAIDQTQAPKGFKTLILEDGGVSVRQDTIRSNISPDMPCNRVGCITCLTTPGRCWRTNSCYQMDCQRIPCSHTDTNSVSYTGETSHNTYSRGLQHLTLYRGNPKEKEKSWMWRHTVEAHGGVMGPDRGIGDYSMEVTKSFRDPFTRIIDEAIGVKMAEDDPGVDCQNSKGEYFQPQFTRVVYSRGTRI